MLNPNSRKIYLDALRPPPTYSLDRAIGTTFSLDLFSVLMFPLSLVIEHHQTTGEALSDPIAMLEALRRTSGKFGIFCQQGRIAAPAKDNLLLRYLEKAILEVRPPHPDGVFHPKIWLLRFIGENAEQPTIYRFLCLSRNLTFDRSWDTVLTLEGILVESRTYAFGSNRPLSDFLLSLPGLAVGDLPAAIQDHISIMADEVLRVRFSGPASFEDSIKFIPIGIPRYRGAPEPDKHRRLLILSPFVSDKTLLSWSQSGRQNVLITRLESADSLSDQTLAALKENSEIFVMDEAAERPEEDQDNDGMEPAYNLMQTDFSGLHAKLFIAEEKEQLAKVLTGSANATDSAMEGRNVEFLVELKGDRRKIGIEAFLGGRDDKLSFRHMLRPYNRDSAIPPGDQIRQELERRLDSARKLLARADLSISVEKQAKDVYSLTVTPSNTGSKLHTEIAGRCAPISIHINQSTDISPLLAGRELTFDSLPITGITSFIRFDLTAETGGQAASLSFVLNLPICGLPAEREKHILQNIITDRSQFLRYLMLILAGDELDSHSSRLLMKPTSGNEMDSPWRRVELPLLEELVRAFSRDPTKIERINELIEDIEEAGRAQDIFPAGFLPMWQIFRSVQTGNS